MNKLLLGTTALISVAAFAATASAAEKIQLELSGYHVGGISYTDGELTEYTRDVIHGGGTSSVVNEGYNEINFGSDSEVHFRGSTTLDNGLKVSFRAELELEDDSDVDGDADQIDEVYIQFDGGFGRLQFGQNDGAMYQHHIAAPNAFVGHGVNQPDVHLDPFEPTGSPNLINTYGGFSGDNTKLTYFTPSMNGLQIGASFTPNPCKNDTGYSQCSTSTFGRNYAEISGTFRTDIGNVELGFSAGYGVGDNGSSGEEPTEWTVGAELQTAGLTIGGSYRDGNTLGVSGLDSTSWDAGISYAMGPWEASLQYGEGNADIGSPFNINGNSWAGGVTYMYGPGMQLGVGAQTLDGGLEFFDGHFKDGLDYAGTSFFIENVISF